MLKAGGMGYLMKEVAVEQLVRAIRQVLCGRIHISQALAELYLEGAAAGAAPTQGLRHDGNSSLG